MDHVAVSGEELRLQGFDAAQNRVRRVATDDASLELADSELVDLGDRVGPGEMEARHDAIFADGPEDGDDGLLVGRDDV